MKVVFNKKLKVVDNISLNTCEVHLLHVQIDDVNVRAREMRDRVLDTSWLGKLDIVDKFGFEACAERTIKKLVEDILNKVNGTVEEDFGEIMVSDTAQCVLKKEKHHNILPIAELIKERVSGNGGFDFHSESPDRVIIYGEAKYSGCSTRYADALGQINDFINHKKDIAELVIIKSFVTAEATKKAVDGIKGYTAAFSINAKNPNIVFCNAMNSDEFKRLLKYKEIYLIGVEVCA